VGRASLTVTAVFLLVTGAPFGAAAGGAKHPFDAMAVHRPAEPFAAPELVLKTTSRPSSLRKARTSPWIAMSMTTGSSVLFSSGG